jgi:hypothetical protein
MSNNGHKRHRAKTDKQTKTHLLSVVNFRTWFYAPGAVYTLLTNKSIGAD